MLLAFDNCEQHLTAGFTLEDAGAACSDDALEPARVVEVLDSLVHKSLVVVALSNGSMIYRALEFECSYGLEKLVESRELERCTKRYAERFAATSHHGAADGLRS